MNASIILIICISSILMVIYLTFLNEESRLLKIIYRKLSKMNPGAHKRILTSSSSKSFVINEIINMLGDVTDKITITGSIENEQRLYQKMERLAGLYAKKEGASLPSGNMNCSGKIGRLRNVNRILDIIALRIESIRNI